MFVVRVVAGVVNRGDSFRRRRSRSNSLAPVLQLEDRSTSAAAEPDPLAAGHHRHHSDVKTYRVAIIGAHGVGKSALVSQFKSSECINAYDRIKNGKLRHLRRARVGAARSVSTLSVEWISPVASAFHGDRANQRRVREALDGGPE